MAKLEQLASIDRNSSPRFPHRKTSAKWTIAMRIRCWCASSPDKTPRNFGDCYFLPFGNFFSTGILASDSAREFNKVISHPRIC
ncbi:hypothetical protein Nepgr_000445 [Nepenthes gracilis]|uniref:Uncharacterized protein n=1 Tax=Nepenthes gracilis TaxID=150966 RepID=A0AAD3P351_NEPGR|nr:hypothetical protein Nepgr_000445 [Nepenthes gracilis]